MPGRGTTNATPASPHFGVGDAEDGGIVDRGMLQEEVLDFGGIDVEAAGDEHVLAAAIDVIEAFGVAVGEVAGVEPAVGVDGGGGGLGLVPEAARDVRSAQRQFAGGAGRCFGEERR